MLTNISMWTSYTKSPTFSEDLLNFVKSPYTFARGIGETAGAVDVAFELTGTYDDATKNRADKDWGKAVPGVVTTIATHKGLKGAKAKLVKEDPSSVSPIVQAETQALQKIKNEVVKSRALNERINERGLAAQKKQADGKSDVDAIKRMSEGKFTPEDFGVSSIASDPKLHALWTQSLQSAAAWSGKQNAYQKYLQILG
jgi:hypothetical protein